MAQAQTKPAPKAEIDLDAQQPAGTSKTKKIIIYGVIALLAVGLGVTTWLLLRGHKTEGAGAEPAKVEAKAVTYVPFKPFIVNFAAKSPVKFFQVEFYATGSTPAVVDALNLHMPAIRNDVTILLSRQTYEEASSPEGMIKLREEIKKTIQNVLDQRQVSGTVDAVYFTSYVMQ